MSLGPKYCSCGCHKPNVAGFFHCFTGPCCDHADEKGQFAVPERKRTEIEFKTVTMPNIKDEGVDFGFNISDLFKEPEKDKT